MHAQCQAVAGSCGKYAKVAQAGSYFLEHHRLSLCERLNDLCYWSCRLVCRQLRWPLIDKDDARDCLQQLSPDVLQQLDANALSYDIMFRYCATQLSLGLSTAMDCPFARVALYDRALEVAHTVRGCRHWQALPLSATALRMTASCSPFCTEQAKPPPLLVTIA